jgi:hypothetical protein
MQLHTKSPNTAAQFHTKVEHPPRDGHLICGVSLAGGSHRRVFTDTVGTEFANSNAKQ